MQEYSNMHDIQVEPEVATEIAVTNNCLDMASNEQKVTNVFVDNSLKRTALLPESIPTAKKAPLNGVFHRVYSSIRNLFNPTQNRSLVPVFQAMDIAAVSPNTGKTTLLLSDNRNVKQEPISLADPLRDAYLYATYWMIELIRYREGNNEALSLTAKAIKDVWRIPGYNSILIPLITNEFDSMVAIIRKLRKKIGVSELVAMLLLALLVDKKLYKQIGCRSDTAFFRTYSEAMGMSRSRARDYCKRGTIFLKYYNDFIEGVGSVTGIPLNDFADSHMSKLTLYEKAVEKFGREEAFALFKSCTFRDFQDKLKVVIKSTKQSEKSHDISQKSPKSSDDVHRRQKEMIEGLNLAPSEKRLLRIIAKGGMYHVTQYLTEEQVIQVESRLHQRRNEVFERNLQVAPIGFERKSYNPDDPLSFSEELFELWNASDIILRIRDGLARTIPLRRSIALLVFRLFRDCKSTWSFHGYNNFRDFAMKELGMGEEYRDYLRVGKILWHNHQFLHYITDMDTEDMFFKLRYLEDALKTHSGNEPLVLARLRTLSIREFKLFSEMPDFEITFSKRLTKKQLQKFREELIRARTSKVVLDFIEVYHKQEGGWVLQFECDVLKEVGTLMEEHKLRVPPAREVIEEQLRPLLFW